jgi:2-desacetyl-2-hydroxyethyl bacteriochlorophyllide A dehydrogenase
MSASRAYEITAPGRGRVIEVELAAPGAGQVLIRVEANGLCASDLPVWRQPVAPPLRIGHEPVGRVVSAGAGVHLSPGTLVAGRIADSFADHAIAELADVVPIPEGIDPSIAIAEPLGCVAEGLRRTAVPLGARVAVVGLGFMGLVMVQLLRNAGVAHVSAIDPRSDARDAALLNGADDAFADDALPANAISEQGSPDRHGYDVIVEASGSQPGLDLATRLVRPHGILSILGYHQGPREVDMREWNWKALDVVNAHVRDRDLLRTSTIAALALQAAGRIDIGRLITHRFPLERVDDAFATLQAKPHGFIKAVIDL